MGFLIYPGNGCRALGKTPMAWLVLSPLSVLSNGAAGVQDADYLALAMQKNPVATNAIVQSMMPKALWENRVQDTNWPIAPITWSSDPDVWEGARLQLAQIITDGSPPPPPPPTSSGGIRPCSQHRLRGQRNPHGVV
jgi:hypothetical protein